MSTVEAVGDATISQEITLDDVYGWHFEKASEYFSSITNNPLYIIPSSIHLVGGLLMNLPLIDRIVCLVSKMVFPVGNNYRIALNQKIYTRALELAEAGIDLSICNKNGQNLVELLYDYNDEMFEKAFRLAFKQNPSFMMNKKETAIDFLIRRLPGSSRFIFLLSEVIIAGGSFDPTLPQCKQLFFWSIKAKRFELTATFVERGYPFDSQVARYFLKLIFTRPSALSPPSELGVLQPYVKDLTQEAEEGGFDHLKTREICLKKFIQILLKKEKNYPIVYGKSGSGKTAFIQTFAKAVAENIVPAALTGKRVLSLSAKELLIDLNHKKLSLDDIHKILSKLEGETIIFIDNVEYLLIQSPLIDIHPDYISFSNLIRCLISHQTIHWVAACNDLLKDELDKDPYVKFFFSEFEVSETTQQETFPILQEYVSHYLHPILEISYDPEIFLDLIDLCKRFVPSSHFPETPIQILTKSGTLVRDQKDFGPLKIQDLEEELIELKQRLNVEKENPSKKGIQRIEEIDHKVSLKEQEIKTLSKTLELEKSLLQKKQKNEGILSFLTLLIEHVEEDGTKKRFFPQIDKLQKEIASTQKELENLPRRIYTETVDKYVIAKVISDCSGVPINKLTSNEKERLKDLESKLQQRVKGQEEAIKAVANTIRRSRLGLNGGNRPRGTFLFLGPTGVGKTELAKALAVELLGSENHMIRFDMSEYQHPTDINRLIGSSPGYVGYEEGGKLTEALKKKPYSVVLIDELEKAHPVCADIFLQVFDDGRLTDGHGETVNCKEAVFIMTSNIGANTYSLPTQEMQKEALDRALKESLRPEFINRIDDILRFNPLDNKEIVRNIAILQLDNLQEKVSKLFNITISWEEEVIHYLTEKGFNPLFGARPLRNLVEKQLMTLISNALLNETLQEGDKGHFSLKEEQLALEVDRIL